MFSGLYGDWTSYHWFDWLQRKICQPAFSLHAGRDRSAECSILPDTRHKIPETLCNYVICNTHVITGSENRGFKRVNE